MDNPDRRVGRTLNTVLQVHQMQLHLPRNWLSAPLIERQNNWTKGRENAKKQRAKSHTEHLRRKKHAKKESKRELQAPKKTNKK
jgi:hypothetical protein